MDNEAGSGVAGQDPAELVRGLVRGVPDFPKAGILFRDVMPVLAKPGALAAVAAGMMKMVRALETDVGRCCTHVVGMEARGFIFGAALAAQAGRGFIAARKPGKLPGDVVRRNYGLEYGQNTLEVSLGLLGPGDAVVVVDDLLATGGTAECAADLCRDLGATVLGYIFLVELGELGGRARLEADAPVRSLVVYP